MSAVTSRACTSITTSAPHVARSKLVSRPRTRPTMRLSCSEHFSAYAARPLEPPVRIASVTSRVQYTCEQLSTSWPGHSRIHCALSALAYASSASPATLCSVRRMSDSTSSSQRSTAPVAAGLTVSTNGIFSPSTETMPEISPSVSNVSSLTASKHFLTNGCTFSGSLASDRISSSSSLERKKKRGNAIFLVSRKSLRPFSTTSSDVLQATRSSSRPSNSATSVITGCSDTAAMMRRHVASISRNAEPSRGICFMISSAPKIGSR
mmetsp:Transcript_31101/g.92588  ORF Transcript_31101/g.92588 Transcript_31101/m.92588 type:complete len:265 (-) Transcript_31101:1501-2295(-)